MKATIAGLLMMLMFSQAQAFDLGAVQADAACEIFRQRLEEWPQLGGSNQKMFCKACGSNFIPPPFVTHSIDTATDAKALSPLPGNSSVYSLKGQLDMANLCLHYTTAVAVYLTLSERAVFYYLIFLETDGKKYSIEWTDQRITWLLTLDKRSHPMVIPFSLLNYTFIAMQRPEQYGWTALKNELFGRSTNDIPRLKALLKQYEPVFRDSKFKACVL